MNILRRLKLSRSERKHHHLVVSREVHEAVRGIAETSRLTMSEAAEYLIRLAFTVLLKEDASE
jgi:hypothetical protein